jgi:hypothetical protein
VKLLVDQHADTAPGFQPAGKGKRGAGAGRNQMSHLGAAGGQHPSGDVGIVGRTEQDHHIKTERGGGDRQQLEIAGVRGKDDEGFLLVAQLEESLDTADFDTSGLGGVRIEIKHLVEKDVFGGETGHVAPHVDCDLAPLFASGMSG